MPTVQKVFSDNAPAQAAAPAPQKAEYEVTDNFVFSGCHDNDEFNLHRLINHPSIMTSASRDYVDQLKGKKFYRPSPYPHALTTSPQTWYLNTARQALRGTDNLRVRFTPYLPNYFELAVKGKAVGFNGPGGLSRHEDELHTDYPQFDPMAFTDPVSQEILAPILRDSNGDRRKLFFFLATNVDRYTVGIEGMVNGKKGMSEIAFDIIRYQYHGDKADEPLVTFHRLCQNEREYMNPHSDIHKDFCAKMGYEMFKPKEIEMLLHQSSELVRDAAKDLGIGLEPCPQSKGQIGFEELARHQGMKVAQPPQRRFAICF